MLLEKRSQINNLKTFSLLSPLAAQDDLCSQSSLSQEASLLIFFYLVNTKVGSMPMLIQFLQKYDMNFGKVRISEKALFDNFVTLVKAAESYDVQDIYKFLSTKANYVAQSKRMISPEEFQQISQYLMSITTVVVFFYQNKIWNWSRQQPSLVANEINNKSTTCDKTWGSLTQIGF